MFHSHLHCNFLKLDWEKLMSSHRLHVCDPSLNSHLLFNFTAFTGAELQSTLSLAMAGLAAALPPTSSNPLAEPLVQAPVGAGSLDMSQPEIGPTSHLTPSLLPDQVAATSLSAYILMQRIMPPPQRCDPTVHRLMFDLPA